MNERAEQCTLRVMRRLTPAVLASLVLQAACTPSGMPSGTPSGTSSHTNRQDFPTYSVSIPPTWTRTDYGPDSLHKGLYGFTWSGVRFEGPDGEYVDISPDLPTDLQGADSWLGAKIGSAGEVMTIGDNRLCERSSQKPGPEDADAPYVPGCTRGDGRLDVWLSFVGHGHDYVITMGNDKRERAEDLSTVRKVVESMRLK